MADAETKSDDGYFSDHYATFGDRVAGARRAAGLTQRDLCRKMGIKLKTLRGWEDDMLEPRANKLQMLAGLLNISLVWLLTGEGVGLEDPEEIDADSITVKKAAAAELLKEIKVIRAEYGALGAKLARLEARMKAA